MESVCLDATSRISLPYAPHDDPLPPEQTPTTPSENAPSPDAVAIGNSAVIDDGDSPGETGDGGRRRQSAIYASLFHRSKHRRSNTTGQQRQPDPPSDEQNRRRHRPGRSGIGSLLDDDISVRVLLEETFSPAGHAGSGSIPFAPVRINALSETLRERRDIRNTGGGFASHNFAARNPFSATMPSIGGRHARGVSTTAVDAVGRDGGGGGFSRTLGFGAAARHKGTPDSTVTADGNGDDDEWDPFAGGITAAGEQEVSNVQDEHDEDCGPAPRREALVRTKSRQLLHAGGRAGCDPREASKLMRKASYFVDVDEGAPLPPTVVPENLQRRRDTERGLSATSSAVPTFSSSGMYRRLSRVAGVSDARRSSGGGSDLCAAEGRRRSSMSEAETAMANGAGQASNRTATTTTGESRPPLSTMCSSGGFAFSCDAKAQRAEIAMILGKRTGPMPRAAPSLAPPNSSTLPRSVQDGGGGGLEVHDNTPGNLPPLHRPSSAVGAGLNLGSRLASSRRFSQPSPDTPADIVEEEDGGSDGDHGEEVEEKKEEGQAGVNERETVDQR